MQKTQLHDFATNSELAVTACDSEHFLLAFNDIDKRFKKDKHVTMEHFYRAMRKQFDILMEDDKPAGGQWNFDANNRNKFSKSVFSS